MGIGRFRMAILVTLLAVPGVLFRHGAAFPQSLNWEDLRSDLSGRKLIYVSQETVFHTTTQDLAQRIDALQALPFDGLGINFHPVASKPGEGSAGLEWRWFGATAIRRADLEPEIRILKAIKWGRFTDNFLWVATHVGGSGRAPANWFSDADFKVVNANARLASRICRETGLKGLFLDIEQYGGADYGVWRMPFDYKLYHDNDYAIAEKSPRPFAEVADKVRQRGREWMRAILREYPDITLLVIPGVHRVTRERNLAFKSIELNDHSLVAPFFDGVLESMAGSKAHLVDGCENGYPTMEYRDFMALRGETLDQSARLSAVPDLYRRYVSFGVGIWPDYYGSWDMKNANRNYRTPKQWEHTVHNALAASQKYVWVWGERARWLALEDNPGIRAYRRATADARQPHDLSWKQGPSYAPDPPETAHYVDFAAYDILFPKLRTVADLPVEGWLFKADPEEIGEDQGYCKTDYPTQGLPSLRVDKFWDDQGYADLHAGWYRLRFPCPELPEGKRVYLHFGAVDESAWLYIDGRLVAWHDTDPLKTWDQPFLLEVTGNLKSGQEHVLVVRACNIARAGGIWKPLSLMVER